MLAARTRDKKKLNGQEVDVFPTWSSTLYITNFPEAYDDAQTRALFAPYGTILETRWPSKRFKGTRRFCYLQFASEVRARSISGPHACRRRRNRRYK